MRSSDCPWLRVSSGLLTPEHRRRMGRAVWLFLWSIHRTTVERRGEDGRLVGMVFGGRPVTEAQIGAELGVSVSTVQRYSRRLRREGYWEVRRHRDGLVVCVARSKKRGPGWLVDRSHVTGQIGQM